MIRSVILDMGGVLTLPQREDEVRKLMDAIGCGREIADFRAAYGARRFEYDRGDFGYAEYWSGVAGSLGLASPSEPALELLRRLDIESWLSYMNERMLEELADIRSRCRSLVLLSNIHADGARYVRSGPGRAWSSSFDELVLSCELRLAKPEAAIYEAAVEAAAVPAAECLFVDDNEGNVEGAKRAGLQAFRFTDAEDFARRLVRDYELAK